MGRPLTFLLQSLPPWTGGQRGVSSLSRTAVRGYDRKNPLLFPLRIRGDQRGVGQSARPCGTTAMENDEANALSPPSEEAFQKAEDGGSKQS
jgi:hypothetical protein